MTALIDFDNINAAALRNGRPLLPTLLPGGTFRSLEYVVRNPRRNDTSPGSFKINFKTGKWADFATADEGGDLVSLFAYVRGVDQGDAARELAEKLGVPLLKPNGLAANGYAKPKVAPTTDEAKIYHWDNEGPPKRADELRRHIYASSGMAKRIKVKFANGRFTNWYRVLVDGEVIGWQAKKPDDYTAVPYLSACLNPFDPELSADWIYWPEGEKDVDTLSSINLPAFTFGGVGDGLPYGIDHYLKDRRIVVLADNDDPGRAHAEKKAAVAASAASIKVVHFSDRRSVMFRILLPAARRPII